MTAKLPELAAQLPVYLRGGVGGGQPGNARGGVMTAKLPELAAQLPVYLRGGVGGGQLGNARGGDGRQAA